jgi:hypothetical protein
MNIDEKVGWLVAARGQRVYRGEPFVVYVAKFFDASEAIKAVKERRGQIYESYEAIGIMSAEKCEELGVADGEAMPI